MAITLSNRTELLGIHTTPALKFALKTESLQEDISMSMLAHRLLTQALHDRGYDLRTGRRLTKDERLARRRMERQDGQI
jgi:hypothetical protein